MFNFEALPQWVGYSLIIYLSLPLLVYYLIPNLFYGNRSTKKRVIIYVLGDISHSPRICNHAKSFSSKNFQVELCGYVDSTLPKVISEDINITVHPIPRINEFGIIRKVSFQFICIAAKLWELRGSNYVLIQNPPSIPIMPMVAIYRVLTGTKLIIDWHNLAYSILALKYNGNFWHPLVLISYLIEFCFSRFADYHLTVTKAMEDYLVAKFRLNSKRISVLYDRANNQFQPFEVTKNFSRKDALATEPCVKNYIPSDFDIEKGDRIIVTSTSFTPDEDIGVLIGALKIYENSYEKFDKALPRITCFITGKGPQKEEYIKKVEEYEWNRVSIVFLWLSAEEYPKLLRLCDYGISLHTSSSGLDLPMKILDMFGSGLPVIAMNYPVLDELVKQDVNGLKFSDRRELHESLLFAMKDKKTYESLKEGAYKESEKRWYTNWDKSFSEFKIIY
ncbi:hypothetical protein KAFR_0D02690 [Kazachstania africana CBS 2517]|uniref:Chitobiosyldiphosphodolichol beta-mannosyltransferase n=1 Tax=Kazachstania africana (strain ATCC 22294 / BCRC 22015 / CBS 2517 / CECT 1963 / NBRC 1671 / NRRL Y-8276) TaxID=1071382 RepID=H2AU67_KAZAF|nr:hypothetical protein KAFR_0D02690 [Kazachstania africana CBS 2517]CCF57917.1 hypothetical protein KAFR_0D02690 [Kazachstania africana CBS 2517]